LNRGFRRWEMARSQLANFPASPTLYLLLLYSLAPRRPSTFSHSPKGLTSRFHSEWIEMQVENSDKDTFRAAADAAGLPLSGWIRQRLRRDAKNELDFVKTDCMAPHRKTILILRQLLKSNPRLGA
jgi:hypothetical protein